MSEEQMVEVRLELLKDIEAELTRALKLLPKAQGEDEDEAGIPWLRSVLREVRRYLDTFEEIRHEEATRDREKLARWKEWAKE